IPRRCGGTQTFLLASKRTLPRRDMNPSGGWSRPASAARVSVLPAPEGPKSTSTPSSSTSSTSRTKLEPRPLFFKRKRASTAGGGLSSKGAPMSRLSAHPCGEDHDDDRDGREDPNVDERPGVLSRAVRFEDLDGHGVGTPRNVPREHQRGTEFPGRASETHRQTRNDSAPSQRKTDPNEEVERSEPEAPPHVLELARNRFERRLCALYDERGRDERGSKDGGRRREHDAHPQPSIQDLAQRPMPPEGHHEEVANDRRRQDQR